MKPTHQSKGTTMSMSLYSYCGSPLHLTLDDAVADTYNKFIDALFAAQQDFRHIHSRNWDGVSPLDIQVDKQTMDTYNAVGAIITSLVQLNSDSPIRREDITSDYLIKLS